MIFGGSGGAFGAPFGGASSPPYANLHYADRAFVYNIRTGTWTEVLMPSQAGKGVVQLSSASEFPVSGQSTFTQWDSTAATGLEIINDGRTAAESYDTFNTSSTAVQPVVTCVVNFACPSPGERVTWHSINIFWEINETFTGIASPTTVTIQWFYDWGNTATQTETPTPAQGTYFSKILVPREARQSTRLRVSISHTASEMFGIEGISMEYDSEGSRETRK
jgi:hypothetical protein